LADLVVDGAKCIDAVIYRSMVVSGYGMRVSGLTHLVRVRVRVRARARVRVRVRARAG
jgi:hypothetical protein